MSSSRHFVASGSELDREIQVIDPFGPLLPLCGLDFTILTVKFLRLTTQRPRPVLSIFVLATYRAHTGHRCVVTICHTEWSDCSSNILSQEMADDAVWLRSLLWNFACTGGQKQVEWLQIKFNRSKTGTMASSLIKFMPHKVYPLRFTGHQAMTPLAVLSDHSVTCHLVPLHITYAVTFYVCDFVVLHRQTLPLPLSGKVLTTNVRVFITKHFVRSFKSNNKNNSCRKIHRTQCRY